MEIIISFNCQSMTLYDCIYIFMSAVGGDMTAVAIFSISWVHPVYSVSVSPAPPEMTQTVSSGTKRNYYSYYGYYNNKTRALRAVHTPRALHEQHALLCDLTWNMMSTTFTYTYEVSCAHEQKAATCIICIMHSGHSPWTWLWWTWLWWPTRRHHLWHSWTMTNDSKHIQACFLLIPTDWLHLRVAWTSRPWDLAIFVVTTEGQTDRPITLSLCMCMG